jgi:hypothetical protein
LDDVNDTFLTIFRAAHAPIIIFLFFGGAEREMGVRNYIPPSKKYFFLFAPSEELIGWMREEAQSSVALFSRFFSFAY